MRFIKGRHKAVAVAGTLALFGSLALSGGVASANLNGSTFESTDHNMVVDGAAGAHDWANAVDRHVGVDQPSGALDNAFSNGSHESEVDVNIDHGSIPNSKADLGRFADSTETIVGGPHDGEVMLYLAWTRNNTAGSTNFDFELNKVAQPNMTGAGNTALHLNRTPGDVLINYALQGGAQTPTFSRRIWNGTVWGPEIAFGPAVADGSTNTNEAIVNVLGGPASIPAAQFGEAAINMTAAGLIPNKNDANAPCTGFGSVYVKSRSSQAFTSEIKDFIAPIEVNLNTCGNIVIQKVTDPSPDPTDTAFPFTLTGGPSALNKQFSLKNGQSDTTINVKAGSGYNATETPVPTGWDLTSFNCDDNSDPHNISVTVGETVTCTATNTGRAQLHILKTAERNASFDFTADAPLSPSTFSLVSNSGTAQDFTNLSPGKYGVNEVVPTGWNQDSATCDNGDTPDAVTLTPGDDVTCTFDNVVERGAVLIHKSAKHASAPGGVKNQGGVTFTVTNGAFSATAVTAADTGNTCVDNVPVSSLDGDYNVHETVPAGYHGEADKSYTVVEGDCASATAVNFVNTPLTDITVTANPQISGATASVIDCGGANTSTNGSLTVKDLEPTAPGVTLTCTIVVDP